MSWLLVVILAAECLLVAAIGFRQTAGVYQYPFLATMTFLCFLVPQAVGLAASDVVPPGALDRTLVMAISCVAMCHLGYRAGLRRPARWFQWRLAPRRLLWASAALSALGAYFFHELRRLPEDLTSVGQWTGLPVAYLFFASALAYGLATATLLYVHTRSKAALLIAAVGVGFYLDLAILGGRRRVAVELVFILVGAAWFGTRRLPPRWLVLSTIGIATLLNFSMGEYRSAIVTKDTRHWPDTVAIDFTGNLRNVLEQGGSELTVAAYEIGAVSRRMTFDFGIWHWNTLVFNYVPAQLLGTAFKENLMVDLPDLAFEEYGFVAPRGSTATGLVDAYRSFWYFGCLKFFLIAFVMARLWNGAQQSWPCQAFYMIMMGNALHSITHHTQWFVSPWVHISLFLVPCLFYSRLGDAYRQGRRGSLESRRAPVRA